MTFRPSITALAFCTAAILSGCRMDADVAVVTGAAGPAFVVTYDGGKAACVEGLTVASVDAGKRQDLWAVRRRDGGACRDRFAYGTAPAGYEPVVAARALMPGRSYQVSTTGTGWSAARTFVR